jgi:DUF4097 and DUF4098 domain-containing protein YvlB
MQEIFACRGGCMRSLLVSLFALCLLLPLAQADEWNKTYPITGQPDLRVETSDANIQVDTWEKNSIEVRVVSQRTRIGENGIRIIEHQAGDTVDLEVRFPHRHFTIDIGTHPRRVDIQIHMPREGRLYLHTGDGDIHLADFKGTMELQSSDGSQDIDGVDGVLRSHAGDGHVRANGRFDGLEIGTGDGRIEARALPGSRASSIWDLHAGDGSVTLQLPGNFAADVDLHTGDGHITLDMPIAVQGRLDKRDIHGTLNGGGNHLSIHTGDGSIRLEQS